MLDNNQYTTNALIGPAQQFAAAGLSVIPVDAHKRPTAPWKAYQEHAAEDNQLAHWFVSNGTPAAPAMAIVCGAVSGNLTVIDFDVDQGGDTRYDDFAGMVELRAPGLLGRLVQVETPSGGRHLYLRAPRCEGNTKLAESASYPWENPATGAIEPRQDTWIETRGEGGYVVAPPSPGYRAVQGSLRAIPRLDERDYQILLKCARALDDAPAARHTEPATRPPVAGDRPGDAYNARATLHEVADLLCRHGWTAGAARGDKIPLTRPGKSPREGTSGDVAFINGIPTFTQFSSNGGPFEPEKGYTAFAVYALLEHAGDYRAAARALEAGAGRPSPSGAAVRRGDAPEEPHDAERFESEKKWRSITALMAEEIPPLRWVIPGLIPEGLTLLAGPPKIGKSLLGLNLAIARATGGRALGHFQCEQGGVLYLCLEDGKRVLQRRVARLVAPGADLSLLHYGLEAPRTIDDLCIAIRAYKQRYPEIGLVVIDTFQCVRGTPRAGLDAYQDTSAVMGALSDLVLELDLDIIPVHHVAKAERADVFERVSGGYGLNGKAHTIAVVERKRMSTTTTLHLVGRELDEEKRLVLDFDKANGAYRYLGTAEEVGETDMQRAVIAALKEAGAPMHLRDLAAAAGHAKNNAFVHFMTAMREKGYVDALGEGMYEWVGTQQDDEVVSGEVVSLTPPQNTPPPNSPPHHSPAALPLVSEEHAPRPAVRLSDLSSSCPGCGRQYTARPAPYDAETAICSGCGTELGSWPDLEF